MGYYPTKDRLVLLCSSLMEVVNSRVTIDGSSSGMLIPPDHIFFPGMGTDTTMLPSRSITRTLTTAKCNSWLFTGVYAPAGKVVSVTIPSEFTSQGMIVMVGTHGDSLWGRGEKKRHPFPINWRTDLTQVVTNVALPHGGPIFLFFPHELVAGGERTDCGEPGKFASLTVTFTDVLPALHFELGVTDQVAWDAARGVVALGPWSGISSASHFMDIPTWNVKDKTFQEMKEIADYWQGMTEIATLLATLLSILTITTITIKP